ncbi:hypothetical protein AKL09_04800 [Idiomarina loihiensis]|uniref:hypothetical protein n=1 Tax=Idiomarina loihiensis TaxID=135577 RepID=UPI00130567DF|nr:hypothetical protein [Idiomarina loihiensis]MRJ44278.1 hypothetical protein [Idiomarina loihiensis]
MRYFKYNHFWFIPNIILQLLILFYVYSSKKEEIISFYLGNGGDNSAAFVAMLLLIMLFGTFIYMPYRIITDPTKKYRFDDDYLYIDSKSHTEQIKLGVISDALVKPKWTRLLAAPYMILHANAKGIKIPSGFKLSNEDYVYFKSKVVVKEQ